MSMDKLLASLWVTPKCDGDIWLRNGGTQKFLAVEVHSPQGINQAGSNPTKYKRITEWMNEYRLTKTC